MTRGANWALGALLGLVVACDPPDDQPVMAVEQRGALGPGVAARVGPEELTISTVSKVASAQNVSAEEARRRAVLDALLALGARSKKMDSRPEVIVQTRGLLAQALAADLKRSAQSRPITDEEVAHVTALHWLELDRPEARRTVHAVVLAQGAEGEQRERAEKVAQRIAEVVREAKDAKTFIAEAKKVGADGFKVVAQKLSPVAADTRAVDLDNPPPPGVEPVRMAPEFTRAVFRLEGIGAQSPVVWSKFGAHVIMLLAEQPARHVPFEERKRKLGGEIIAARAKYLSDQIVAAHRAQVLPQLERNASASLSLLQYPAEAK